MFSDYTTAPRHEIRRVIEWYRSIEADARLHVERLESILAERERYARYRDNINALAVRLMAEHKDLSGPALVDAVAAATGKPHSYAAKVADAIQALTKKRARAARNQELTALAARVPKAALARQYGVTRQTVHKIVSDNKKRPLG